MTRVPIRPCARTSAPLHHPLRVRTLVVPPAPSAGAHCVRTCARKPRLVLTCVGVRTSAHAVTRCAHTALLRIRISALRASKNPRVRRRSRTRASRPRCGATPRGPSEPARCCAMPRAAIPSVGGAQNCSRGKSGFPHSELQKSAGSAPFAHARGSPTLRRDAPRSLRARAMLRDAARCRARQF